MRHYRNTSAISICHLHPWRINIRMIINGFLIPGFRICMYLMRIRIQIKHSFYLRIKIQDPDTGFDDLKLEKNYRITGEAWALKREHPVLKTWKVLNFLYLVIYSLPDPDPATQINADPCGYESGSVSGSGHGSCSETLSHAQQGLWW